MPVKAVRVNEEVQACRPNTCQWRAARVLEDANQGQQAVVKLKFIGDTTVHYIPWAYIKIFRLARRESLFKNSISSRPASKASRKVVSIDLTALEDFEEVQPKEKVKGHVNGTLPRTDPRKDDVIRNGQVDYSSSVTSDRGAKPKSPNPKPPGTDPYLTSSSDLNDPLSISDQDVVEQDAVPSDVPQTSQTSTDSESVRVVSNSEKKTNSFKPNAPKPSTECFIPLNADNRCTQIAPFGAGAEASKTTGNNELDWEAITQRVKHGVHYDSENTAVINDGNGKALSIRTRAISGRHALPVPEERHPHQALEDVPIPRARPQLSSTLRHPETEDILIGEVINVTRGLTPSKRPRFVNDAHYKYTMKATAKPLNNGSSRRMQKKARRVPDSFVCPSTEARRSLDLTRESLPMSETSVLGRYKPSMRFPYVSVDEECGDGFEKLIIDGCHDMVNEHKNEVQALLQSFGELEIKKTSLTVRNQGSRKKSKPKRWTDRKDTERVVFEHGMKDLPLRRQPSKHIEDVPSDLINSSDAYGGAVGYEIRCGCQSKYSGGPNTLKRRSTIQCGLCGYWSHLECVGFSEESVDDLSGASSTTKKHFVCSFCVDDATNRSVNSFTSFENGKAQQQELVSSSSCDGNGNCFGSGVEQEWQSHVSPVVLPRHEIEKRKFRRSKKLLETTVPRRGSRFLPRSPLSGSEVVARAKNVELLRSGLLKPSVGLRERELVDGKPLNFNNVGFRN